MKFKVGDVIFDKDSDFSNTVRGLITEVDEKDRMYVIEWSFFNKNFVKKQSARSIDENCVLVNWNRADRIWQEILNETL
jgi:hypothetical protein